MDAINSNKILISPLVIQEYVYTLNKLKVDSKVVYDNSRVFEFYCKYYIDSLLVSSATALASKINSFSNINDILHLKFAENYCSRLITYDSDFNKFKQFSKIEIEILE
jgi:predicted nucleic acid-binding protein